MKNIVVLISGNGSNLQAIINACKQKRINGNVCAVFSNKADAFGLERARNANIPTYTLQMNRFANSETFDYELIRKIDDYAPNLIVLAGYMSILSPVFIAHYKGRILNIHPSLLPKYPGLNTHRKVLENGDKEHGTSIHFVTNKVDGGPIIIQARIPIFLEDSESEIITRVQTQEYIIYPMVISWFIDKRLIMYNNASWLDGVKLPKQGLILHCG